MEQRSSQNKIRTICGIVLSVLIVTMNLLSDLMYQAVDPRIKLR